MALYPLAVKRLLPLDPKMDPRETMRVVILHVAASETSSLYDWFNGPSGGVEAHFYIRYDGTVEQYRDTAYQADANMAANDFAISIETEGLAGGTWTTRQLAAIKALLLWCHKTHDIPLVVCPTWDGSGVGYHILFEAQWDGRNASCPGPKRIDQFKSVLVPWMRTSNTAPQEDDMQLSDIVTVTRADGKGTEDIPFSTLLNRLQFVYSQTVRNLALDSANADNVKALAAAVKAQGADVDVNTLASALAQAITQLANKEN